MNPYDCSVFNLITIGTIWTDELESAPPVPAWKKFLLQFKDTLVYLLIATTVISAIAMVH